MEGLPAIHLVHFYSAPGGIEVLSSRLLHSFGGYTFRVFVIRPREEGRTDVYEGTDVAITYGSANNLIALFKLWRYVLSHRHDIFHLFNLGPFFLLSVRLAGARHIIYSVHGTRYWKNPLQRIVRKPLWRLAAGAGVTITANSEYSKNIFSERVLARPQVKVIYNPIGSRRFVPPAEKKETEILKIIYAGRLNEGKNLEKWVDVAIGLHGRMANTLFEIYGTGPLDHLLSEKINGMGADSYISLKGYRSDIENVFRDAGLLLFLSEYESFGNVVVESILCGTPVIATDIPSMREIFRDFPLFLVSPEGDLCDEIAGKLKDYDKLSGAAEKAGINFRERFSEEAYIDSMNRIYTSCNG
jgi:glycosyltransferase involved in cell wall biosynthesis